MITAKIYTVSNNELIQSYSNQSMVDVEHWLKYQIPQIEPKQGQSEYMIDNVYRVTVDIETPVGTVQPQTQVPPSTTVPENLNEYSSEEAKALVADTENVEVLEQWLKSEHRKDVKTAIAQQIKAVSPA